MQIEWLMYDEWMQIINGFMASKRWSFHVDGDLLSIEWLVGWIGFSFFGNASSVTIIYLLKANNRWTQQIARIKKFNSYTMQMQHISSS